MRHDLRREVVQIVRVLALDAANSVASITLHWLLQLVLPIVAAYTLRTSAGSSRTLC